MSLFPSSLYEEFNIVADSILFFMPHSDIRPKLNAEEVQQVAALLSSIPLPKKKEKKKNPIIVTAEERRRSNAQVLDASWGEKSLSVREEMRVSVSELPFLAFQDLSFVRNNS